MCIRLEISSKEGIPVGISELDNFYSGKAGDKGEAILEYAFPELMPGEYSTTVLLYKMGADGNSERFDCVSGLSFEIKLSWMGDDYWRSAYWGHLNFNASAKLVE